MYANNKEKKGITSLIPLRPLPHHSPLPPNSFSCHSFLLTPPYRELSIHPSISPHPIVHRDKIPLRFHFIALYSMSDAVKGNRGRNNKW